MLRPRSINPKGTIMKPTMKTAFAIMALFALTACGGGGGGGATPVANNPPTQAQPGADPSDPPGPDYGTTWTSHSSLHGWEWQFERVSASLRRVEFRHSNRSSDRYSPPPLNLRYTGAYRGADLDGRAVSGDVRIDTHGTTELPEVSVRFDGAVNASFEDMRIRHNGEFTANADFGDGLGVAWERRLYLEGAFLRDGFGGRDADALTVGGAFRVDDVVGGFGARP